MMIRFLSNDLSYDNFEMAEVKEILLKFSTIKKVGKTDQTNYSLMFDITFYFLSYL